MKKQRREQGREDQDAQPDFENQGANIATLLAYFYQ